MVSIQGLKAELSAIVALAESGETITITRHNAPVAQLNPAGTESFVAERTSVAAD